MLKKSSRVTVKNVYFNNFCNITTAVNSPHNCYQESKFLFTIIFAEKCSRSKVATRNH